MGGVGARDRSAGLLPLRLLSDERLIARARAGDARAFEAIYDRYERPLRAFCRHMLGRREDADDAAQHVFLSAYRDLIRSDKPIELRPWLFTIARNRCRSVLRSRYRAERLNQPLDYEPSVDGLAIEAQVERREYVEELLRDIARLPEEQRAALILSQLEALRHDEVAQVLAVPADKVKALVFQARTSLIASQQARETSCRDIRAQLSTLSGPALRRRALRRHVRDCDGCREYERRLVEQRQAMVLLLPVASAPALRQGVLANLFGGAGGGGALGGAVVKTVALKSALAVTVVAGGAGMAVVARHPSATAAPTVSTIAAVPSRSASRPGAAQPVADRAPTQSAVTEPAPVAHAPQRQGPRPGTVPSTEPPTTTPPTGAPPPPLNAAAPPPAQPPPAPPDDAPPQGTPPGHERTSTTESDSAPPGQAKKPGAPAPPTHGSEPPGQSEEPVTTTTTTTTTTQTPGPPASGDDGKGNRKGQGNGNGNGGNPHGRG